MMIDAEPSDLSNVRLKIEVHVDWLKNDHSGKRFLQTFLNA